MENDNMATTTSRHSSDISAVDVENVKPKAGHLEAIHTNERVPGHENYYEKNGLRTYGDDEDHDHEPPVGHVPYQSHSKKLKQDSSGLCIAL